MHLFYIRDVGRPIIYYGFSTGIVSCKQISDQKQVVDQLVQVIGKNDQRVSQYIVHI